MDTTRRGFLQLFGFGGAAVAATGGLFSFGGSPSNLVLGRSKHLVFDETLPLLETGSRAHFLSKESNSETFEQARRNHQKPASSDAEYSLISLRGSRWKKDKAWSPSGDSYVYRTAVCSVPQGEDPHISFFMAATELQRKIDEDALHFSKFADGLPTVTVVDLPIMAFPDETRGFYLETHLRQYFARLEDIRNPDQAVSSTGEIPIETPNHISFKYLMLMQEELRGMGMLSNPLSTIERRRERELAWAEVQRRTQKKWRITLS